MKYRELPQILKRVVEEYRFHEHCDKMLMDDSVISHEELLESLDYLSKAIPEEFNITVGVADEHKSRLAVSIRDKSIIAASDIINLSDVIEKRKISQAYMRGADETLSLLNIRTGVMNNV